MSDGLGKYAFLPWLRRGAASQIARVDGTGPAAPRASFQVALGFNAGAQTATTNLALYGPGEVSTFETRTVIRTWPRAGVLDAESNYFPLVEFDQADLPWRYTAARATGQHRLRPWIVLIALKADEIESYSPTSTERKLPAVKVKSGASLPDLGQSWAWAHVQVSGRESVTAAEAASLLATAPHTMLSRLLAPRRLDPKTKYRAFVVPAFERGRLSGLGQTPAEAVDALAPAWASDGEMIELPVYFEWEFQTAAAGDFEYLVRLLKARAMPPTVGTRPIDVAHPDPALPAAATVPMRIEGALLSPTAPAREWNAAERTAFVDGLSQLLNRPADLLAAGGDKIVAPPLYGRWHAARQRIDFAQGPRWFYSLNSDPRDRVHAGLGTLVVQDQQEKLMAGAWQQVDRIREINEKLRLAQLARESAIRIHKRHLQTASTESFLATAAPMFARVKGSPQTIRKLMADSPIGTGVFDPQFRRVARPRGPVGVRQKRAPDSTRTSTLLDRMNRGVLQAAPRPQRPSTIFTPDGADTGITPGWLDAKALARLELLPTIFWILVVILILIALLLFAEGAAGAAAIAAAATIAVAIGTVALQRWAARMATREKLRGGTLTGTDIRNAPPRPGFTVVPDVGPGHPPPPSPPPAPGGGSVNDSAGTRNFRGAIANVFDEIRTPRVPGKVLRPVALRDVADKLVAALDPQFTIAAALLPRLQLGPSLGWAWTDPLEPVMAAPEFEQPMYEPLRDLSQDWLLPGLDQVPSNTISLLETNQQFVEDYMAGLNHEMARELLWREYPTDQRGTYFRQFWDVRGYVGASSPDALKDIKPITAWDNRDLGQNSARAPMPGGKPHLVLLIRGDLLRRYPTAVIYAVKARKVNRRRELTDPPEERHPVFRGTLRPDVSFFGFELTEEEVPGRPDDSPDQGWFFMIQEQPAEPRFGFDAATWPAVALHSWNDLNWAHFAENAAALADVGYVDLDAARPDTSAVVPAAGEPAVVWHAGEGTNASHTAWITLQRPVRVAVHGSDMLP